MTTNLLSKDLEILEQKYQDDLEVIRERYCKIMFDNKLALVVRSIISSNDEGGSNNYSESYMINQSDVQKIKDYSSEEEKEEEEKEESCSLMEKLDKENSSTFRDKRKELGINIDEIVMFNTFDIYPEWDYYTTQIIEFSEDSFTTTEVNYLGDY